MNLYIATIIFQSICCNSSDKYVRGCLNYYYKDEFVYCDDDNKRHVAHTF